MFGWVVLGHFPFVAVSHIKKKKNKQTNKKIKKSIPVY